MKWRDIEQISEWDLYAVNRRIITRQLNTNIRFECIAHTGCTACPPGSFKAGNGTNDGCTLCEAGKYSDSPGSTGCVDCPAGKYGAEGVCTDCPDGKYQPNSGESQCIACERYCQNNIIKPISKQDCGGTSAGSLVPLTELYGVGDICSLDNGAADPNKICCQDWLERNLYCKYYPSIDTRYCALDQ